MLHKFIVEIPTELPPRKNRVLRRMVALFESFRGKVPASLLDSIEALADSGLDTDAQCEELEALIDYWTRLN